MADIRTKNEVAAAQGMYVVKSNTLIQKSRYSLTLLEQKAVLFLISKITKYDDPNTEYTFDIHDFCLTCNLSINNRQYTQYLKTAFQGLASKSLSIDLGQGRTLITTWFSSIVIDEQSKSFQVRFDKNLHPFLFELKSFYTQYSLENVLPMSSKYGIRLFEFLKSVQSKGYKQTFSIEEIKERIDIEQDKYPHFKDFRKYVLEPALEDINKYSDIVVKALPLKTGKKYTHIEFIIVKYTDPEGTMERYQNRRAALGDLSRATEKMNTLTGKKK